MMHFAHSLRREQRSGSRSPFPSTHLLSHTTFSFFPPTLTLTLTPNPNPYPRPSSGHCLPSSWPLLRQQNTVQPFTPYLPDPPVFAADETFRSFVLTKALNGEQATLRSPSFAEKRQRARQQLLDMLTEEAQTKSAQPRRSRSGTTRRETAHTAKRLAGTLSLRRSKSTEDEVCPAPRSFAILFRRVADA